jgi:hypothetical protein
MALAMVMVKWIEAAIRSDVDEAAQDAVVFRSAGISASSRLDNYQEISRHQETEN